MVCVKKLTQLIGKKHQKNYSKNNTIIKVLEGLCNKSYSYNDCLNFYVIWNLEERTSYPILKKRGIRKIFRKFFMKEEIIHLGLKDGGRN